MPHLWLAAYITRKAGETGRLPFTRQLARGLDALGIGLGDHLVLAGDAAVSLRAGGIF